jgi:citrate synthase
VRLVGSSQAPLHASISAGIGALWGALHGGANQKVVEMLEQIAREGGDVGRFVERAKDKASGQRLMGFGHRVYKNYDPRASILKQACSGVLGKVGGGRGQTARLLDIAMQLERVALEDDYFISHKLYPNVDFYSGVIYKALDIPVNMFTVMFAMGRMAGWIAQWQEMRRDPQFRIGRPRQVYTGHRLRHYTSIDQRA